MTHVCVGKLVIIGSDNGLSPDRRQTIIWTNAELLSIGPLRTYFSENLIKMQQFSLGKIHLKMSSAKWRPSCLGLNVLTMFYRCDILHESKHHCYHSVYKHLSGTMIIINKHYAPSRSCYLTIGRIVAYWNRPLLFLLGTNTGNTHVPLHLANQRRFIPSPYDRY